MPDASDSGASSWPGFIAQLNKTFMLVRDAFGYALPGAVFLAIGLVSGRYSLCEVQCLLLPYHVPAWAGFLGAIAASYAAGSLMAATIYMPIGVAKYLIWLWNDLWPIPEDEAPSTELGMFWRWFRLRALNWLIYNPTEVTPKILEIRAQQGTLLDTLDRRETLNVMSGSMAAALLAGWYVFYHAQWNFSQIALWGGVVAVMQFLTGLSHLRRVGKAVVEAKVDKPESTDFNKLFADLMTAATAWMNKQTE
jgi:hypothetical protein